jgi:hypothetical protein
MFFILSYILGYGKIIWDLSPRKCNLELKVVATAKVICKTVELELEGATVNYREKNHFMISHLLISANWWIS